MFVAPTLIIPAVWHLSSAPDFRGELPMNGAVCSGPVLVSTARLSSATVVANECRRALEDARVLMWSVRLPFFNQRN